jgi:hypothetical protein
VTGILIFTGEDQLGAIAAGSRDACCYVGDERACVAPKRGREPFDVAGPEQILGFPVDTCELVSVSGEVLGKR